MKRTFKAESREIGNSGFLFNSRNGSITGKNGVELFLEHRLKKFFAILIENKNDVVTRDELMTFVWKDLVVSDESVTKAASDLRKFFATHSIEEFQLITISKLGYKLQVTELDVKKNNVVKSFLKITGYILLSFLLIIVIIRAINY